LNGAAGTKRGGRGLGWSSGKILDLYKEEYAATLSSIHGVGIRAAIYAARVRDEFLKRAPSESMSSAMEGSHFDLRRWHGRSADACVQAYKKSRSK
jgi:hypothetical protein